MIRFFGTQSGRGMISKLLSWFGYYPMSYGAACGRSWIQINGKVICQSAGDDFYLPDATINNLARVIFPNCEWEHNDYD